MIIIVLGSAAGGGFPQWNCNCDNCRGVRQGCTNTSPRSQSSIAVSVDGDSWVLLNASPDIRQQLSASSQMHPRFGLRDSPIVSIVLLDAQIDHMLGLFVLREGCPLTVYCTSKVHSDLSAEFPVFKILSHWNGGLEYRKIEPGTPVKIDEMNDLIFLPVSILSNAPPYSPTRSRPDPEDNIALIIQQPTTGKRLFYAPGLCEIDDKLLGIMEQCDCLMVDGTFWDEDEMCKVGLNDKKAREMGHLPLSGDGGIIERLEKLAKPRKILVHINNTNPVLNEDSEQYKVLMTKGIEVSFDGMQVIM